MTAQAPELAEKGIKLPEVTLRLVGAFPMASIRDERGRI
jgi:hypothetical protein